MNELVLKADLEHQKITKAVEHFITKMFPTLIGEVSFLENEYGKYLFADGTIFKQTELADAIIEYAWNYDFDNAIIVNTFLFGDCGLLHYAMVKAISEVCNIDRKSVEQRRTYLMMDAVTGLVKIGASSDVNKRLEMLTCGNPNLFLIAIAEKNVENKLHREYRHKRMEREFYSLSQEEINAIIKEYGFEEISE